MRHKDQVWDLPPGNPNHRWESIHAALLMDIRDELRGLRALFHCPGFLAIPGAIKSIERNTKKKPRNPKVKQ